MTEEDELGSNVQILSRQCGRIVPLQSSIHKSGLCKFPTYLHRLGAQAHLFGRCANDWLIVCNLPHNSYYDLRRSLVSCMHAQATSGPEFFGSPRGGSKFSPANVCVVQCFQDIDFLLECLQILLEICRREINELLLYG